MTESKTSEPSAIAGSPPSPRDPTGHSNLQIREPEPGDLGWIVQRHGAIYWHEHGWDQTFEVLVARIVTDFATSTDPERQRCWIAELDGQPVGCVMCCRKYADTAQLRLLLVEPAARGLGLGEQLVNNCIRFARDAGYRRIVLWTNDVLGNARSIYERVGFALLDEEPHHSFGHDLVGQHWSLELSKDVATSGRMDGR